MKKFKKVISIVLCLMMVLSSIPTTAFAALHDSAAGKGSLELVMLKANGSNYVAMTDDEVSALTKSADGKTFADNNRFFVGVKATNFNNVAQFHNADDAAKSLVNYSYTIEYNTDYLIIEPAWTNAAYRSNATRINNQIKGRLTSADSFINKYNDADMGYTYTYATGSNFLKNSTADNLKKAILNITYTGTKDDEVTGYVMDSPEYLAILEFGIVNTPTESTKVDALHFIIGDSSDTAMRIGLNANADGFSYRCYPNPTEEQKAAVDNIENVVNYDDSDVARLFKPAAAKPDLSGTPTITGTTTAGETLTADVSGLSLSDGTIDASKLSYVWKADGTAISGATSSTFTLTGAQIGKKITVEVTYADASDATKTKASAETAAVAAAALPANITLSNATPTFGDTLTVTGLPTGWSLAWTYGDTAADASTAWTTQASAQLIYEAIGGKYIKATATAPNGSIYGPGAKLEAVTTAPVAKLTLTTPDNPTLTTKVGVTSIAGGNATPKGGLTASAAYKAPTVAYTVSNVAGVDTAGTPGTATVTFAAIPDTNKCYAYAGDTVNNVAVAVTDKTVTKVEITAEPTKLAYTAGETLDLTGMTVKVTYDNATDETVAAADFASKGITANPANGTTLAVADTDKTITVTAGTQTATTTGKLTVTEAEKPVLAGKPAITGTPKAGETLTANVDNVTLTAGATIDTDKIKYQWQKDGVDIADATAATYELPADIEAGAAITVKVTYDDADVTNAVVSDAVTVVEGPQTATVVWNPAKPSFRVGSVAQVTATIGTFVLTDLIEYELPATTTEGTPAKACDVEGCVHEDGSECTAVAAKEATGTCTCPIVHNPANDECTYVPATEAQGTCTCDGGTHDATNTDCTYVPAVAESGTCTCERVHDATNTDCEYVPATEAVACTTPGCVHADKSACTAVKATAGTETPARWVKWADEEAAIKALPAGTYNLRIDYTAINDLDGFTDIYNALTETPTNTMTITKKSSGGGGGGSSVTSYTVRFDADKNGEFAKNATTSVRVEKDATIAKADIPAVTAKEGFKFIGWSLDGKTVVDPTEEKVTGSVTYTALYKEVGDTHEAYMKGNEKGQFMPDAKITRAEAAALFARLIPGYDENTKYTGTLKDVTGTEWFANEVMFDVEKGYITGYEDGTFRPTNAITRQEFCIIVAKYLGYANEGTTSFADCKGVFAEGYIAQLIKAGYVNGYEDGTFRPHANITRAEATKILNAVFDRVPDKAAIDAAIENYEFAPNDVAKRHWAYYEIMEAAVDHDVTDFHATK